MMIYIKHQVMLLQDTDSINASRFSSTVAQKHNLQQVHYASEILTLKFYLGLVAPTLIQNIFTVSDQ